MSGSYCLTFANVGALCSGNGNVLLKFGNAEYIGMGFFVFSLIIIFEIFGSPFFRNGAVFLSLLFGYIFAVIVPSLQTGKSFVNQNAITAAPVGTFLWTTTFPLSEWLLYVGAAWPRIQALLTRRLMVTCLPAAYSQRFILRPSSP